MNGTTQTVTALFGTGVVTNTNGPGATLTLSTFARSTGYYFGGTIADGATNKVGVAIGGGGLQVFTGANTYSGGTTITSGTLRLAGAGNLGSVSGSLTVNGGVLDLDGISVGVGSLSGNTGGAMIVNNSGATLATLTLGNSDATGGSFFGVIADNSAGSGRIGVTKVGGGTQVLTGANTFTGPVTIRGGTLKLDGNTGSLNPSDPLTMAGIGTFSYLGKSTGSSQALGPLSWSAGDGTLQALYGGSGSTSLSVSSLARSAGATGTFVVSGGTNGATNKIVAAGVPAGFISPGLFFSSTSATNYAWNDTAGYLRAINYASDVGAVTRSGGTSVSGTFVQTTAAVTGELSNTFTSLNVQSATAANGSFTLAAGATMTVNGILKTGGGDTSNAAVISGGAGLQAVNNAELVLRSDQAADALTIATPILANGVNPVTVSGNGLVRFTGANGYTGATTINGRTILKLVSTDKNNIPLSPSIDIGSSAQLDVTGIGGTGGLVLNGAIGQTLLGRGTILGAVTVAGGSRQDPGESVGTLTMSDLTLGSGAILDFEFNRSPANDFVKVTDINGLDIIGGGLNLYQEGTTNRFDVPGTYHLFGYSGNLEGTGPASLSVLNPVSGMSYAFSDNPILHDVDLTISAVPEPSSLFMSCAGTLCLIAIAAARRFAVRGSRR